MMFDIILAILFVSSTGVIWYRISERIPELVAIQDEVIVERLHEDSARIRIFLLNLKSWWREKQYREPLWRFCEKIVYRLHIFLLRADNGLVRIHRSVRVLAGMQNGNGNVSGKTEETVEKEAVTPSYLPPHPTVARIQEVRRRKDKDIPVITS